jgi:hypothetical protein
MFFPRKKPQNIPFSENYVAFEDFLPKKYHWFAIDPFLWMHLLTRM